MRRFANLYILLFLADAGLSLADELLVALPAAVPLLSGGRSALSLLVVVVSVAVYLCLGIDRRLPKRLFLPLVLFVFWNSLAFWPLAGLFDGTSLGLAAAAAQMLLGAGALGMARRGVLSEQQFRLPLFSWRNTLGFTAINLLLLPFTLVYTGLAISAGFLEQQTAGFLRLSPLGIYMSERSYHHDAKMVRLAGMMHIGREDYYRDLAGSLATRGAIILLEGVSDRDRLLENPFNYDMLAELLGLTSQETMLLDGILIDLDHLDATALSVGRLDKPVIARADTDLNRFDPQTIEFLNMLGKTLFSGKSPREAFAGYNLWVKEHMTPERIAGVMADILDKRDAVVIDGLERSLAHYDTVIIPWGAMHMPAIEAAVLQLGFEPGETRERLSLDFRTIPYGQLWRKLSGVPGEG